MGFSYNQNAGQSVARLPALSNGIFAVAMMLLRLELRVAGQIHNQAALRQALTVFSLELVVYLMSLLTLGIFWPPGKPSSIIWRALTGISPGSTWCFELRLRSCRFRRRCSSNFTRSAPGRWFTGRIFCRSAWSYFSVGAMPPGPAW